MLLDFLYTQDIWAMACLVVFSLSLLPCFVLALSSKLILKDVRKKHMELVSYGLVTISIFRPFYWRLLPKAHRSLTAKPKRQQVKNLF
jgi:hypothetical protein